MGYKGTTTKTNLHNMIRLENDKFLAFQLTSF